MCLQPESRAHTHTSMPNIDAIGWPVCLEAFHAISKQTTECT